MKTSKAKKAPTLKHTIWLHFAVFTAAILVIIWLFQVVTLDKYYEFSMRRKIVLAGEGIELFFDAENPQSVENLVESLAHDGGIAITITDWNGNKIAEADYMSGNTLFNGELSYALFGYRNELINSSAGRIYITMQNNRFGSNEILYGAILQRKSENQDGYLLFINSPLAPIETTVDIIKEQFIFIALITFLVALVLTTLLSARLSSPFTHLTASAKKLAKGDYKTKFNERSYREIEELSGTLNYTASEISKVDQLKNELIANVSHDLRTPLTMIKAYAEMIRDLSGNNPEKREEHLGVIIEESDRLTALVNSLLELSKLQSKNSELNLQKFSSLEFLNGVMEAYSMLCETHGFEISLETTQEDAEILADKEKLTQVMHNFINNAINYSGDSKKIIIRRTLSDNTVRIEVQDFGIGIEKEKLPQIFERYYRGDRAKRDIVGTGLGLSIVKEILELHSYRFGVTSELNHGSTFWFEANIKR